MAITRRRLVSRVKYWRHRLGLDDWEIHVSLAKPGAGDDAECEAEPRYKRATIRFNLDQIDPDELDNFIAHELWHIPVWALAEAGLTLAGDDLAKQKWVEDMEEQLVTHLERVAVGWGR